MKRNESSRLLSQLVVKSKSGSRASAAPLAMPEDGNGLKLRTRIELEGDKDPAFPELFKSRRDLRLPGYVFLEPLIVIKKAGRDKLFDFEFISSDSIFLRCPPSECNPGMAEKDPLALAWMGVTNSKAECESTEGPVSRGFVTSWINPEEVATVRWREEANDDQPQRIASFFFVKRPATGSGSATISRLVSMGALIDPTVVYDKDDPPG